jgi:predicted ATPase
MITRIEAYRYRCFEKLAVDFDRYSVVAGPNGSGKSTLLDIPSFLGDCFSERTVSDALLTKQLRPGPSRAHTLNDVIHKNRGTDFVLAVEAAVPTEIVAAWVREASATKKDREDEWLDRLRYEIRFEVFNNRELHITNEYLYSFSSRQASPELGGGLQGEMVERAEKGRVQRRLQKSHWVSILDRDGGEPARMTEEGYSKGTRNRKLYRFNIPPTASAMSGLPFDPEAFPFATWFQSLLSTDCLVYEPDYRVMKQAVVPGQSSALASDGKNLAWLALELFNSDPEGFGFWVDHVRTALPQVDSITPVQREEDFHAYFKISYRGGYEVTSSGLSEGTLQILALTLPAYLPNPLALFAVEQPEDGVHPSGIGAVLQALSSIEESQIWLSTHSPIVLAQSKLDDLLLMRIQKNGSVGVLPASKHPRFQDWKEELDLGTFYAAGVLD